MPLTHFNVTFTILSAVLISGQSACSLPPRNYEDCVLQNMKGTNGDLAARAVQLACYDKFPPK